MKMQNRERWVPVSMTGDWSIGIVAAKESLLSTRPVSGLMPEGGGLPVQDRRGNCRRVREVHVVAFAMTAHGEQSIRDYSRSRSRLQIGQQLPHLGIPSYQPVSLIL
jgi:hypothetical protein